MRYFQDAAAIATTARFLHLLFEMKTVRQERSHFFSPDKSCLSLMMLDRAY